MPVGDAPLRSNTVRPKGGKATGLPVFLHYSHVFFETIAWPQWMILTSQHKNPPETASVRTQAQETRLTRELLITVPTVADARQLGTLSPPIRIALQA
jgi:hypothetical protein